MTENAHNMSRRKVRHWPGMPTQRSKMFEFVLGFFPSWIAIVMITLVLMMSVIQSCREWVRDDAGRAPAVIGGEEGEAK